MLLQTACNKVYWGKKYKSQHGTPESAAHFSRLAEGCVLSYVPHGEVAAGAKILPRIGLISLCWKWNDVFNAADFLGSASATNSSAAFHICHGILRVPLQKWY